MAADSQTLIPYFMPSLSSILVNAEDKKGAPLDYDEAVTIRDGAACIMMKLKDAKKMDDSRGYVDIDPENLWYEWQMLRRELNRKPDLDPGPSFAQIDSSSYEYQKAIIDAKGTLSQFRSMLPQNGSPRFEAMVKLRLSDGEDSAFIWLANTRLSGDEFVAEIFEVPEFFPNIDEGQSFTVSEDNLVDWMVNENGTLHGGFSIRVHCATLSPEEQMSLDEHIGVSRYA